MKKHVADLQTGVSSDVEMTAAEVITRQQEEQAWADGANARAFKKLREDRNTLLAETDFYALSDVTMSSDMGTYRQELRDLPADTSDPTDVTWPTKPS